MTNKLTQLLNSYRSLSDDCCCLKMVIIWKRSDGLGLRSTAVVGFFQYEQVRHRIVVIVSKWQVKKNSFASLHML